MNEHFYDIGGWAAVSIWNKTVAAWEAYEGEFKQVFANAADWAYDIICGFIRNEAKYAADYLVADAEGSEKVWTINRDGHTSVRPYDADEY